MNPIAQGLALGYTGQQLLSFITRIFPNIAPRISRAQNAGHSIDSILSFLEKSMDAETGNKGQSAQKTYAKNREKSDEISKTLAKTAIAGLGGFAAKNALASLIGQGPAQSQQPPPQPPQNVYNPTPAPPTPPGLSPNGFPIRPPQPPIAPQPINPTNPSPNPVIGGSGQPAGNPIQTTPGQAPLSPVPPSPQITNVVQKLASSQMSQQINQLLGRNPPNIVAQALKGMNKKAVEQIEKEANAPIEQVIEEYAKTIQQANTEQPPNQIQATNEQPNQLPPPPEQQITQQPIEQPINEQPIKEPPKEEVISKKIAFTPSGDFGEVESNNGKISKINVDGKTKTFNNDKLIESPYSEKDIGDLYDEMMSKIPEKDRSAAIFWAGYDEKANKLSFIPHGGSLYTYNNIPKEFAEKLKDSMFQAKTTGETTEGKWLAGGESRGAGLFKLIQELQKQYGGKGKEYEEKFESIFDAIKPARDVSRKKKEDKRKAEKEASKKAKEDEKARKKTKK